MGAGAGLADGLGMPPSILALAAAIALMFPSTAAAMDERDYWAFADRLQPHADHLWSDRAGYYTGSYAGINGSMLLTHAVAALRGHAGPARNDRRARRLVDALVASPPFVATLPPHVGDAQPHAPGFVSTMSTLRGNQHMVIDTEIVDGLRHAWIARRELGLTARQSALIADRIHRTAMGSYYRWPTIRLNQINWYALMYAADATVTGRPRLLRRDLRLQIARFAAGARGSAAAAGNLGPGLHFHYFPHMRRSHPMNVDSAEYANITASFLREYRQARRAGMRPPSPAARRLLRRWLMRVIAGYWTHGGYVNWDTGFGFRRWHQAKKFGLSQQALIGIATAPGLAPHRDAPAWAKWMLDRGFAFYERQLAKWPAPRGLFFGVDTVPQDAASARLALARVQSNAARAVAAGLGSARAKQPPPLYAFDPDTGRLAITTPAYSTAVVPSSRGAFPYGGIDLARLHDARQEPAGGIGGRPPAAFGVLVRDISGRKVVASQLPDRGALRLTRAPSGVHASASAWTGRAFAGPFSDLRAAGIVREGGVAVRTRHRFTRGYVGTRWRVRRASGRSRQTVDVLFPSTGRGRARVTAVLRDGSERPIGLARRPLRQIVYLHVRSADAGYVVVPRSRPPGATVHLLRTRAQSSAPDAGPTLAVQLARESRARHAAFSARVAPVTAEHRDAVAARLLAP
jgi:hypothetical protein